MQTNTTVGTSMLSTTAAAVIAADQAGDSRAMEIAAMRHLRLLVAKKLPKQRN